MIQAYDRDGYSEEIDNTDITDYTAHFTREICQTFGMICSTLIFNIRYLHFSLFLNTRMLKNGGCIIILNEKQ